MPIDGNALAVVWMVGMPVLAVGIVAWAAWSREEDALAYLSVVPVWVPILAAALAAAPFVGLYYGVRWLRGRHDRRGPTAAERIERDYADTVRLIARDG